jgi:geranylgeranyl pyrophosphate synthase
VPLGRSLQADVPQFRAQREALRQALRAHVAAQSLVPPLSLDELRQHALAVLAQLGWDDSALGYAVVLLNNEVWAPTVAAVPYNRRLLLVPQCLRDAARCSAQLDELGLTCARCGACSIDELHSQAEELGYVVLVAEGSAAVTALLTSGQIDAMIGVSCLSTLENIYPHVEAAAIPALAIPLLRDGCASAVLDLDWLHEALHMSSAASTGRLDLEAMRTEVARWFELPALEEVLGPASTGTERIAREFLAMAGKRWRPFLAACAYAMLAGEGPANLPESVRKIAIAVECFHKASLVHDDIEDGDATRYGQQTLHCRHGVPVALNVGDFLLGEGYRLIAAADVPAERTVKMIEVAARGHRTLSLGQGAELCWRNEPRPLTTLEVLEVLSQKTAPAFTVALHLGALCAAQVDELEDVLDNYSECLGVAYQIRDDIEDTCQAPDDALAMRPSVVLALAWESATGEDRAAVESLWRLRQPDAAQWRAIKRMLADASLRRRAEDLMEFYKGRALASLRPLKHAPLKALLRRVLGRIFAVELPANWCEHSR